MQYVYCVSCTCWFPLLLKAITAFWALQQLTGVRSHNSITAGLDFPTGIDSTIAIDYVFLPLSYSRHPNGPKTRTVALIAVVSVVLLLGVVWSSISADLAIAVSTPPNPPLAFPGEYPFTGSSARILGSEKVTGMSGVRRTIASTSGSPSARHCIAAQPSHLGSRSV